MSFISVKDLNFEYPQQHVLKNISFELAAGSVTALVGPNGAGKTTLLRCLTSLEQPMSGHVFVNGIDVHDRPHDAHKTMGYLSDFFGVYDTLTVRQCLTYMAWCQKIPPHSVNNKIEQLTEEIGLTKHLDKQAGALSRGYKQRLGVGLALIHEPQCLILDEPASGMDPEARIQFSELILHLKDRGMTLIVSSHILAELEDYCTDMLVIREGEVKSHILLKDVQKTPRVIINISLVKTLKKHINFIKTYECVHGFQKHGDHISIEFEGDEIQQQSFLKALITKDIPVYQFATTTKTLKAAYMDLAEKKEKSAS